MLYNGNFDISGTPEELRASPNPVFKKFTEDALSSDVQSRRHDLEVKHQRQ
jgi:hypothetical protein